MDTLDQVCNQEPALRRLQPKLSRDLETICLKCLQKEVDKRYADGSELAHDLQRFLEGAPIKARPVGPAERVWRWCRRYRQVALRGAAFALLAVVLAGALASSLARAARDRQTVNEARMLVKQRLRLATEAVARGDDRRALDLLTPADPLVERTPALADVRARVHTLASQVGVYGKFKRMLDQLRFETLVASQITAEAPEHGRALIGLYDQIERQTGPARDGLPPLSPRQSMLFKEDVFDAFLVAAHAVIRQPAGSEDREREAAAGRMLLGWLDRAEALVPGTKAVSALRYSILVNSLGDLKGAEAEQWRSETLKVTTPVDHYWHGYAERHRGEVALGSLEPAAKEKQEGLTAAHKPRDTKETVAQEHFRQAAAEMAVVLQTRPEHFWARFDWAGCQLKLNNPYDADVGYTACIQLRPDYPWLYSSRAAARLHLGQFDDAILDYGAALERDPNSVATYFSRAKARQSKGQTVEAIADYARIIALDSDNTAARLERARAYFESDTPERAFADLDRVLALRPGSNDALLDRALLEQRLGHVERVSAHLERARSALRQEDVDGRFERAMAYQKAQRHDLALVLFDQVLQLTPSHVNALFKRAESKFYLRDLAGARDDYSEVVQRLPKNPVPLKNRAKVHFLLKDFDASLADWAKLRQMAPKDRDPPYYTAIIQMGRRQYDAALSGLDEALARDPKYALAYLARARIRFWRGDLENALKNINFVVDTLAPANGYYLNDRLDVFGLLSAPATARARSANAYYLNDRPDVYRAMGQPDAARSDYERSIALQPKQTDGYIGLALLERARGVPEKMRAWYDRMVEADSTAPRVYLRRAEYFRDTGDLATALADCAAAERNGADPILVALARASIAAARGEHTAAAAQADAQLKVAHDLPHDGRVLYAAACALSLASRAAAKAGEASRAEELAERATALLADALDRGFHDLNYQEQERMNDDPALEPIRSRDRVRALLTHRE
jgi:tetratricopeptide (TPR) repeat protein